VKYNKAANDRGKYNLDAPIGALKTQLSKLLLSVDRIGWQSGATSGRFDIRRTSRMLAGSERVFKSRVEDEAVTTAVTIVVDLSSSMSGRRAEAAAQTAWALADAINRVGCMVQVVGFSSGGGNPRRNPTYMRDMSGRHGAVAGIESLGSNTGTAQVLKDFGHKLNDRRPIFEYMHALVGGSTPDYHIVRTVAEQMALVPAHRKLCIVITDGAGDWERMKKMGNVSEQLWKLPIVGIGIQTDNKTMRATYKYYVCINKIQDLAEGALRIVIKQLEDQQPMKEAA